MPQRAGTDAMHLAIATVYELDLLLTWNCRHLANANVMMNVGRYLRMSSYEPPMVITPYELMGETGEQRG